jgi:hypothetical protein
MKNTVIWSFLSVVVLGASGLVAGCDSDDKLARSALGESCDKTADCDDGLKCIGSVCSKSGSSGTGGSGNQGDGGETSTGATAGTAPIVVPPVLGGEGESCSKRADCKDGLGCFSDRCQKAGSDGEGGEGPGGAALGTIGETCGLTTDCANGLACLPQGSINNNDITLKAIGSNSVGVCTPTDNGLTPTGKSCQGAECTAAEDCCELPVGMHATLGANSCAQLADLLDGVDCDTPSAAEKPLCFANSIYCECTAKTWTCSDAGRCNYNAACDSAVTTFAPDGCPSLSRAGYPLVSTCDEDAKKCQPPAGDPVCKTDADCVGETTADTLETCVGTECTCLKTAGLCYVKCGEDLDCMPRQSCDTKTKVCVDSNVQCTTDAFCVVNLGVGYSCVDGECDIKCKNDLDCNYGQLTNGSGTRVCNAAGRCEDVGCTDDDECPGSTPENQATNVRLFCTDNLVVEGGEGVHSAITD